jgi:outer membrane biosynthesis protein TonB
MNSKNVLDKIITMLSFEKKEDTIEMTYAKLADGTIVESPTFDVGEALDIVSEDGTKSPAPNGTHELALRDSEGRDVLIKVVTEEGKIVERENVELPAAEEAEVESEMKDEVKMEDETVEPITEDTDKPTEEVDMKKVMEEMSYRIEELEKKMEEMGKYKMEEKEETEEVEPISEMSLPKLDGAPIEDAPAQRVNKFGKKVQNSQSAFLSKLYK